MLGKIFQLENTFPLRGLLRSGAGLSDGAERHKRALKIKSFFRFSRKGVIISACLLVTQVGLMVKPIPATAAMSYSVQLFGVNPTLPAGFSGYIRQTYSNGNLIKAGTAPAAWNNKYGYWTSSTVTAAGTYVFEGYNAKGPGGTEYWGFTSLYLDAATYKVININRTMPYASAVTFSPQKLSATGSTTATVNITKPFNYPYSTTPTIKAELRIKQPGSVTVTSYTTSSPISLGKSGKLVFNNISLPVKGQYKFQVLVYTKYGTWTPSYGGWSSTFGKLYRLTDSWAWTNGPVVITPSYTVSGSSGTGGTVSPTSITVKSGATAKFTVKPDAYHSVSRTLAANTCGSGTWSGNTYIVTSVTKKCSVKFQFSATKGAFNYTVQNSGLKTLNGTWKVDAFLGTTLIDQSTTTKSTASGAVSFNSGSLISSGNYGLDFYFTANDGVTPAVTEYWGSSSALITLGNGTAVSFTRNMPTITAIPPSVAVIDSTQTVTLNPTVYNGSGKSQTLRTTIRLLDASNTVVATKASKKKVVVSSQVTTTMPSVTFGPLSPGKYKHVYILEQWINNHWQPVDHGAAKQFLTVNAPTLNIVNPGNPNLKGTWTVDFYNTAKSLIASKFKTGNVANGIQTIAVPSLNAGKHLYKVYFQASDGFNPPVKEFWGQGNIIAPLTQSPIRFSRNQPWANANKAVPASIATNGNSTINTTIINNDSVQHKVRCMAEISTGATVISLPWTNPLTVLPNGGTGGCSSGFTRLGVNGFYNLKYWVQVLDINGVWVNVDHGVQASVLEVHVPRPGSRLTSVKVIPSVVNASGRINAGKAFSIDAIVTNNGQTNQSFWVGSSLLDPNGNVVVDYPPVPTAILKQSTIPGQHSWPAAGGQPVMKGLMIPAKNSVTGIYTVRVAVWNKKPQAGVLQPPLASVDVPLAVTAIWEQQVKLVANGPTYIIPIGSGGVRNMAGVRQWLAITENDFYVKDAAGKEIQLTNAITARHGAKLFNISHALNQLENFSYTSLKREMSRLELSSHQKFGQIGNQQVIATVGSIVTSTVAGEVGNPWVGNVVGSMAATACLISGVGAPAAGACFVAGKGLVTFADMIATARTEVKKSLCVINSNGQNLILAGLYKQKADKLIVTLQNSLLNKVWSYTEVLSLYNKYNEMLTLYHEAGKKYQSLGLAKTDTVSRYISAAEAGVVSGYSTLYAVLDDFSANECANKNQLVSKQQATQLAKFHSASRKKSLQSSYFSEARLNSFSNTFALLWKKQVIHSQPSLTIMAKKIGGSPGEVQFSFLIKGINAADVERYLVSFGDGSAWSSSSPNPATKVNHFYLRASSYNVIASLVTKSGKVVNAPNIQVSVVAVPVAPVVTALNILGRGAVNEGGVLQLSAQLQYSDNTVKTIVPKWSVDVPSSTAVISTTGWLQAMLVNGTKFVKVTASALVGNIKLSAYKVITVYDLNFPIKDNTLPIITPPANLVIPATSTTGISTSNPAIFAFLNGAVVSDNVTQGLVAKATVNGGPVPATFPPGLTTVTFSATDAANNTGVARATVDVKLADISVNKTNNQIVSVQGKKVTYNITVKNAGPSNVIGATVTDALPASLKAASWTCVATVGSTCAANGQGNINDTINLLAGGTATYTLKATLAANAVGALVNTAIVAAPVGVTDANLTNNSATDTDTIIPPNQPPVLAANAGLTTAEDTPVVVRNVMLKTTDVDNTPAQLNYTLLALPASGQLKRFGVSVMQNGTFTQADIDFGKVQYVSNLNFNGADSFWFSVSDGQVTLPKAQFRITVTPVNDPPTATSATITTREDVPSAGVVPVVKDVDIATNGDTHTFTIVTQPAKGTATVVANKLVYTPNLNANGADSFTFTATDRAGKSVTGKASVTVTPVNDPPNPSALPIVTSSGQTGTTRVLHGDPDIGDTHTYTLTGPSAQAVVKVNPATGAVTYTPKPGFAGQDVIAVTVTDQAKASGFVKIAVTVKDTVKPVITPPASITVDASQASGAAARDAAINAFLAAATAKDNVGVVGGVSNNAPAIFPLGTTTVTFTAKDAAGNTATATATVTVRVAPPVPGTPGGLHTGTQKVSLSSVTPGASIYYTTDGTIPSAVNGMLYKMPVAVSVTTMLKAIAIKAGAPDSRVISASYTIQPEFSWRYRHGYLDGARTDVSAYAAPQTGFSEFWATPARPGSAARVGDVNGDGTPDLVVADGTSITVYDAMGKVRGTTIPVPANIDATGIVLEDVDGDGANEILVGTVNHANMRLFVYKANGSLIKMLSRAGKADSLMSPVAYLGKGRLLVSYTTGFGLQPRGYALWDLTTSTEQWFYSIGPAVSAVSVADISGDGVREFLATTSTPHNGSVGSGIRGGGTPTNDATLATVLLNEAGRELLTSSVGLATVGGAKGGSIQLLTDLEGDGIYEIVATVGHNASYPGDAQVQVLNLDGTVRYRVSVGADASPAVAVADVNGDGIKEILVSSVVTGVLQRYDNRLQLLNEIPVVVGFAPDLRHGAVADIDGNGIRELLVPAGSTLHVYDGVTLAEKWKLPMAARITDVMTSDVDGDQGVDLFVTTADGRVHRIASRVLVAPAGLRATANGGRVKISWKDRSINESGFIIEQKGRGGFVTLATVPANSTSYAFRAPLNRLLKLRVRATNALGSSRASNVASISTLKRPVLLKATAVTGPGRGVVLTWRDRARGEKGYLIQRKSRGTPWHTIGRVRSNMQRYSDRRVTAGNRYRYRVQAFSLRTHSVWSGQRSVRP